jgi:hypothetical protein
MVDDKYKPHPLTEKLSKIFNIEIPKSEEALAKGFKIDSLFAVKVRQELPESIRLKRLEPHLNELTSSEFAAVLEFFSPRMKMYLMKKRGDLGDRTAKEILETYLTGDPTAPIGSQANIGFIKWWEQNGYDVYAQLKAIGYTDKEIEEKFKIKK